MTIEKQKQVVDLMIDLYCHKKHKTKKGECCKECQELKDYCSLRLSKCPFGDGKNFCSVCPHHCYDPVHRQKIKDVMRFSGPRMLFHHPILALSHVKETIKAKRRLKKEQKKKQKEEAKKLAESGHNAANKETSDK